MKYSNPRIPEGINVSPRHPLKEFALLAGGALLLIVLLSWLLAQFGGRLAKLVPFEYEQALAPIDLFDDDAPPELDAYLQQLAMRLTRAMALPNDVRIQVHFSGADTFNAFATLGGHVMLYRGLVEELPNENALAMLMAHEFAHVEHRDPIVGVGQGAAITLAAALLLGDPNLGALGQVGVYAQLRNSREMERAADATALTAVNALYGHIDGTRTLFAVIQRQREESHVSEMPAIFSSHPLDAARIDAIDRLAVERGFRSDGEKTPLPASFHRWMQQAARAGD